MTSVNFAKGKIYGVLRARVVADNGEDHSHKTDESHYNLISVDDEQSQTVEKYQINIDIQSLQSANVKCIIIDPFVNTSIPFSNIPIGFTPLQSDDNDNIALDFIRRPIFDIDLLTKSQALTANEIAIQLDNYFKTNQPNIFVFGTKYDDGHTIETNHYGLQRAIKENKPSRGIDDIHMNQIIGKDGHAYQDGALFIQKENEENSYIAFFFCFLSQFADEKSADDTIGNQRQYSVCELISFASLDIPDETNLQTQTQTTNSLFNDDCFDPFNLYNKSTSINSDINDNSFSFFEQQPPAATASMFPVDPFGMSIQPVRDTKSPLNMFSSTLTNTNNNFFVQSQSQLIPNRIVTPSPTNISIPSKPVTIKNLSINPPNKRNETVTDLLDFGEPNPPAPPPPESPKFDPYG
ncbi:unnamed protein product [Adineta steineri]|uniref:Uncharacterized protein n=2 Tax=Adineta steineri TaxID=433720 RepID=A0A814IDY4_9BILA|nr:unnamed protein product [Adineta steineri]